MADLKSKIAAAERNIKAAEQASETYESRRQARDRSFIANLVVCSFVGLVIVLTCSALWGKWSNMKDPAEFVLKLLSSVMLPVVTLVIGYYFGKAKSGS